jgi:hypothetical protein
VAQGRSRPDSRRVGGERPADAARAQGSEAGRPRPGEEPDPLHLVAQSLISAPTTAACASRRPAPCGSGGDLSA